ncbi:uncharacterized protein EV422DRAFT_544847 [Fimicolochytrium jonesii]|uniref:uncharacterized protein n=1 Tax=Fimicolochytrium jonesii TaxID=1396493 RepID=UPI0022FED336|nr:uncharacterized protein EV422DRAFT_544847 [Fimicolochytrium jonesii]KAI8816587.1 hypothetical protein EV422DRAFT_544847 [Fimicolochytrium jonesii]
MDADDGFTWDADEGTDKLLDFELHSSVSVANSLARTHPVTVKPTVPHQVNPQPDGRQQSPTIANEHGSTAEPSTTAAQQTAPRKLLGKRDTAAFGGAAVLAPAKKHMSAEWTRAVYGGLDVPDTLHVDREVSLAGVQSHFPYACNSDGVTTSETVAHGQPTTHKLQEAEFEFVDEDLFSFSPPGAIELGYDALVYGGGDVPWGRGDGRHEFGRDILMHGVGIVQTASGSHRHGFGIGGREWDDEEMAEGRGWSRAVPGPAGALERLSPAEAAALMQGSTSVLMPKPVPRTTKIHLDGLPTDNPHRNQDAAFESAAARQVHPYITSSIAWTNMAAHIPTAIPHLPPSFTAHRATTTSPPSRIPHLIATLTSLRITDVDIAVQLQDGKGVVVDAAMHAGVMKTRMRAADGEDDEKAVVKMGVGVGDVLEIRDATVITHPRVRAPYLVITLQNIVNVFPENGLPRRYRYGG